MTKTPQRLAWELFRENKNATAFDITFCVEAEVTSADCHFVNAVQREYDRLSAAANQSAEIRAFAGVPAPQPPTDFKRTI